MQYGETMQPSAKHRQHLWRNVSLLPAANSAHIAAAQASSNIFWHVAKRRQKGRQISAYRLRVCAGGGMAACGNVVAIRLLPHENIEHGDTPMVIARYLRRDKDLKRFWGWRAYARYAGRAFAALQMLVGTM